MFERRAIAAASALAVVLVGLAVAGAIRSYSPVPFWDMWDGYIQFYQRVTSGDYSAWWAQHNEHRLVLARLLFWLDLRFFGGTGWFLIAVNYALIAAAAVVLYWALSQSPQALQIGRLRIALGLFITAWLFLWCQQENMTWAFQVAFILAQLLPLCAFLCLYKSDTANSPSLFIAACLLGLASIGTMANGILALPLMTAYALLRRLGAARWGLLLALSTLAGALYLHGYQSPAHHGHLSTELGERPLEVCRYVLSYLGNPFFYLFGRGSTGKRAALIAGVFFIVWALRTSGRALRERDVHALQLGLLLFVTYVVAGAVATAGGRLIFGIDQAFSSRYTTPTLIGWAVLAIVTIPGVVLPPGRRRLVALSSLALLSIPMVAYQVRALTPREDRTFDQEVAALALELDVHDEDYLRHLYSSPEVLRSIARPAIARKLSVFGMYPFDAISESVPPAPADPPSCIGAIDAFEAIDGIDDQLRVRGWLFGNPDKHRLNLVRLLDASDNVVGYALAGERRPDMTGTGGQETMRSGFRGYIGRMAPDSTVTAVARSKEGQWCRAALTVPTMPAVIPIELKHR